MRLRSTIYLALRRLRRRPVRSFLLLQGTVWGVAVAILPVAVLDGTREAARANATSLGADRLSVKLDPTASQSQPLRAKDVEAVRSALDKGGTPARALAAVRRIRTIPLGPDTTGILIAATPDVVSARGMQIARGRPLRPDDPPDVCVVEAGLAAAVDTKIDLGATLVLPEDGRALKVVGITRARDPQILRTDDFGFDTEHPIYRSVAATFMLAMGAPIVKDDWKRSERCIYVPIQATPESPVDWIFARVSPDVVRAASRTVQGMFAESDRAVVALHATVLPVVLGRDVDRFSAVNVAMFLACLFMGAVVMANLGLLSALSRGREVAIRRVEGATRGAIAGQFLVEGFVLASVGSVLGCLLGIALARLRVALSPVSGFAWTFPWTQAAIATGVAVLLGLAASALPAWRVANQSPTTALADE